MAQILIFIAGAIVGFGSGIFIGGRQHKNRLRDIELYKKYESTAGLYEGVRRR